MKLKEKHIENLMQSKKSGIRIGSRGTPHRLRQYEQKKVEIARKRWFLEIKKDDRVNTLNIWEKYAEAQWFTPWTVEKDTEHNRSHISLNERYIGCLLYTSDAADD